MISPENFSSNFDVGLVPVFELASDISLDTRYEKASNLIKAITSVKTDGWPVGLERRLSEFSPFPYRPASITDALARDFGLSYKARMLPRSISDRPDSELAAYYLWNMDGQIDVGRICNACRLLGGSSLIRQTPIFTTRYASGQRVGFLPASQVEAELSKLIHAINQDKTELDPFILAMCLMLKMLVIHPFADGNGRISRLLYQYTLFRHSALSKPLVPLFPYIESHKSEFLYSCLQWELKLNPQPLADFMIDAACATLEAICSIIEAEQ